jgi:hypothetical protein
MAEDKPRDELFFLRSEVRRLRHVLSVMTPDIGVILRRRGFRIYKKGPSDDLLLPASEFLDDYYRMLQKYSFRLFLRDVIKQKETFSIGEVAKYASEEVTHEYLEYIAHAGLVEKSGRRYRLGRRIKSFGQTLEWYFAELLKREFGAETIWGVKFKRANVGGDYDVISKFDGAILYAEVKSSPPKQIYDNEISAFLDRVSDLRPEIAVFFMDTELRMKDKIVPMFEAELKRRLLPPDVVRIEKELFEMAGGIYIINAKDSIVRNVETVLDRYFRSRPGPGKAVRNGARKPV